MADEDILQANTDFGAQVINASTKPRDYPITIDGIPAEEYVRLKRMGKQDSTTPLFDQAVEQAPLFGTPEAQVRRRAPNVAADDAYSQSVYNNDMEGYRTRKEQNADFLVVDEALDLVRKYQKEQFITDTGRLDPDYLQSLPVEEQVRVVTEESARLDQRKVIPMDFAIFMALEEGYGQAQSKDYKQFVRENIPLEDLQRAMRDQVSRARNRNRWDVEEVAAQSGWNNWGEVLADVGRGDFIPIASFLGRIKILDMISESIGAEPATGLDRWGLGNYRAGLREQLVEMTPEEFQQAQKGFNEMFNEWQKDPQLSLLITRYQLLEQMEMVFTEDVYDGKSAINKGDEWLGNFESLLEGTFSLLAVKDIAKGVKRLFRSPTESVRVRTVAQTHGSGEVIAKLDEFLNKDEIAVELGMEADAAVPTQLPRPALLANDVEQLPDGTKDVLKRSERIRSEILESTESLQGQYLTKQQRTNAVNKELTDLDINDGAHVQGKMSTLQMLEGDVGFKMRVVVGETARGGYKDIKDAIDEAIDIAGFDTGIVNIHRVNSEGVLEPVFDSPEAFARAATKGEVDPATAGRIAGGDTRDESFYLVYDREHYWHSTDKDALGTESIQSSGLLPRALLAPNAKFGDEIYGSALRSYMGEQALSRNFEIMFEPYYRLGKEDKKFVGAAYEWMEDFGKNHGRAPDVTEIYAKYDGITEAQLNGIMAMRTGMDTLHELFNRRLYRDWKSLDYKTARPRDAAMPTYHGKVLDEANAGGGEVLDPVTGEMKKLTRAEVNTVYNRGGRIIELDMPVVAPNTPKARATRVLVDDDAYEVGELSTKPLTYHPGYSMRFYDDPYFIVKETEGVALNGSVQRGASNTISEAIRTAGTQAEAERFARRANRAQQERGESSTFRVVRANDLEQTESSLFMKQAIHREGRLFWDNRNFDRLPDVNGSRATLEDPVRSLERGLGQAARQLTHEDMLKSLKGGWKESYKDVIGAKGVELLDRLQLKELSQRLGQQIRNTVDGQTKQRLREAKEVLDYFRLLEGTESAIIPRLRERALALATTINRITGAKSKRLEQWAMTTDPFKATRSVAFNLFMVFRPIRQLLLQSSQIGYLAPLKPKYVFSGQVFSDGFALQRGIKALRTSGYDDGFSVKKMAESMNMTEGEYRRVLKEFDRSGLIDLVDVHSFAGASPRFRKTALPTNQSPLGTIGYRARQGSAATRDWFQKIGFNKGERNNLSFTYGLALRRLMDDKGYKSVMDLTRKDWDFLKVDASNLALGMVRPNNFGYQTGILSVPTQFLGFSHKAALGMLAQNPAISKADAVKILMGTYMLYGANMFGARDYAAKILSDMGVQDRPLPGSEDVTLIDVIAGGMIDTTINYMLDLMVEDYKEVDFGFVAPGLDIFRLYEMQFKTLLNQPYQAALGPFGSSLSKFTKGADFAYAIAFGTPDVEPGDKFMVAANALMAGTFPLYNDAYQSYMAYKMDQWYSAAGEPMALRPTMNALIARGLLGARTREEIAYYDTQRDIWNDTKARREAAQANYDHMSRLITLFRQGVLDEAGLKLQLSVLANMYEDWPEGARLEILNQSLVDQQNDSVQKSILTQLVEAVIEKGVDPTPFIHRIDEFTDIPEERRNELKAIMEEAHSGRVNVDAEALRSLEED